MMRVGNERLFAEARRVFAVIDGAGLTHPVNRVQVATHRRYAGISADVLLLLIAERGEVFATAEVAEPEELAVVLPQYLELAIAFATCHRLAVAPLLWWHAQELKGNDPATVRHVGIAVRYQAFALGSFARAIIDRPGPAAGADALETSRTHAMAGFLCACQAATALLTPRLAPGDAHGLACIVDRYQRTVTP